MIINPYDINGNWYKGNLHTHTQNSPCGHYSLEQVIDMYKSFRMKYDFLAITDHFQLTPLYNHLCDENIVLFSGTEYKRKDLQTLGINITKYEDDEDDLSNHQAIFDDVASQGGINVICHPHAFHDNYWPLETLLELHNYIGIEIYNNNVKFDNKGRAVAVDLWDKLLSKGKRIFGFANDDMHIFQRCGGAFNMVLASEKNAHSIIEAIKKGSFYGSTGIFLESITVKANCLTLTLKHTHIPAHFAFIGCNGKLLKQCSGSSADYVFTGNEGYVRVQVSREDGAMAWTQPFWIEP